MQILTPGVQGPVFLGAYFPFLTWWKVSRVGWRRTVPSSYPKCLYKIKSTGTHCFPSERQCGHLEAEDNSPAILCATHDLHTGGDNSTCSTWGSPGKPPDKTRPTNSFVAFYFFKASTSVGLMSPSITYNTYGTFK